MSVFTPVSRDELARFLGNFDLGELLEFQGIAGGSENTNFFVTTTGGRYVLTLIEREPVARELPFFIALLDRLHEAGLPVPYALTDRSGVALQQLNGRAALLQPRFAGGHVDHPGSAHCAAVGKLLAELHQATADSGLVRADDRGPAWVLEQGRLLAPQLEAEQAALLAPVLEAVSDWQRRPPELPAAVLHADLFRDNLLFEAERLSGVIDFYNAASGWCLYDLAITCNDWCLDRSADGRLQPATARIAALLEGYAAVRPFTGTERAFWPDMLRLAAARFWLSRHIAAATHTGQSGVLIKDPQHFVQVLQAHRDWPPQPLPG